ncbi:hypothetical protein HG531_001835 [Fusarium graminearum]|nr:hypothetical protein HG531_001835 [Fusarium graminearum]
MASTSGKASGDESLGADKSRHVDGRKGSQFSRDEFLRVLGKATQNFLSLLDQIFQVGVCAIELAHSELGVVCSVDAFIAERRTNLKDLVNTSDDETLEPELRCNTERQIFVLELGGSGDKGTSNGATRILGQDWGLELEESFGVEIIAHVLGDLSTKTQDVNRLAVHQHINMTLLHSRLRIRELLGNLLHGGRQELRESLGFNGEFTGLSTSRDTSDRCQTVSIWDITG